MGLIKDTIKPLAIFTEIKSFSRIWHERGRILGCERAYARSHPKIRVHTTEITKELKEEIGRGKIYPGRLQIALFSDWEHAICNRGYYIICP